MITIPNVLTEFATLNTALGSGLVTVITAVLLGVGAMLVLGFAVRKIKSKVTGKKF